MNPSLSNLKLALPLLWALGASGEQYTCPATADTWVSMPAWENGVREVKEDHSRDRTLLIGGRQSFALLRFDLSRLKGLRPRRATLRLRRQPDPVPLHTVGLSTISGNGAWEETATFVRPAPDKSWSYAGSDLADVTFAQGGSLYSYKRATDAGDGWYEVEVPGAMVAAMFTGDQFGLMLTDEKGQTQARHAVFSRESAWPPVLLVDAVPPAAPPPPPVRSLKQGGASTPVEAKSLGRTTLRPGGVVLSLSTGGAQRVDVRYGEAPLQAAGFESAAAVPRWCLNPLAPKPQPMANENRLGDRATVVLEGLQPGKTYYFAARAIDEAGRPGPVSTLGRYRAYSPARQSLSVRPPPETPLSERASPAVWAAPELVKIDARTGGLLEQSEYPHHKLSNPVWDAASSTVRLTGARNEFLGFQLAVEGGGGASVSVSKPLFASSRYPAIQVFREWYVPDEKKSGAWYPDALIPADIPVPDGNVPGQRVQPFFVDVYVPHDAGPGVHEGRLSVTAGGVRAEVGIRVEVRPLTLPDKLNFIVDLNCYSRVGGWSARPGTAEYRAIEHSYHRMAHAHRTNLDVLGYSHNGDTVPDHAPPLSGEGASSRISDWSAWDAHFGPLAGGSAFAGLPRDRVPAPAMYLPFFENWPSNLAAGYKHNNYPVARTEEEFQRIVRQHALESGPVEESFSREYQDRFSAVAADFARHLKERGWLDTRYLVYFNNKYYYKRPSQGGRGVSWWLMDEPNHRDDIRATAFLGMLLKRGLDSVPGVPVVFRTDISRVEWIRDLQAGQIELNCVSRQFFNKNRYLMDDRARFGREYWHYASTSHPRESNAGMRAWAWRVWLNGGDGLLPWNAVRGMESWDRAEPLTVFYPGAKFGRSEPFASLRLKAYRRGQQDIEYLVMLAKAKGWDRDAVTRAVARELDLKAEDRQSYEEDAGTIAFGNASDKRFDAIIKSVAERLR